MKIKKKTFTYDFEADVCELWGLVLVNSDKTMTKSCLRSGGFISLEVNFVQVDEDHPNKRN